MPEHAHHGKSDHTTRHHNLGTVRLQNAENRTIILVPVPSTDPNDPLNWSKSHRYYIASLLCLAMVLCNFLGAGPSVAIVSTTYSFFGTTETDSAFVADVSRTAYLFTTTALMQGLGNLVWMPLIVKYGRRPVYVASFVLYTAMAVWVGAAETFAEALVARIVMGFAAGSGECLAPLTISDIFYLHERGSIMAWYTASLNVGVSIGTIVAGLITIDHSWRDIYWVATALIGTLTIVVIFTLPETAYHRTMATAPAPSEDDSKAEPEGTSSPAKHTYIHALRLYNGALTTESLWTLFRRPFLLLLLPPVLWATLVMSVTIGFSIAIASNFATAFATIYSFEAWQSGLCFIASLIGSALGVFFGGPFSERVADYLTRRNNGIREPEFRLPAISIGLVAAPLALILYGVGIDQTWHWLVPTVAMGMLNFSIAQATNVSLVYVLDAYRPIAGETVVTQLAFKSAFGFLLSFYTNPWIAESGYQSAFGVMAAIAAVVLATWIPFFLYGKRIRHSTLQWPIMRGAVQWSTDRETGE
ncbi:hypothetical protein DOTSEDRAFT_137122 [Dothistroma septosporum NZE10]|uniref:Major facilitator superfamily (MFS) profile domain-containing protein n=1 Tax=Dothistroma septosporum (strain NZE10 / CBS 128990) TaxID=675120 RepID=N1PH45_DOTSN|nr:hypothetical protein DOTSEDRAFT_137122 [Dothistroma septosporum NZE10]